MTSLWLVLFLSLIGYVKCFYVPGVTPNEFKKGEKIPISAVKLLSQKTQLPYSYYSLPFCEPKEKISYNAENLGSILRGDRIVNTPYWVKMGENSACIPVCSKTYSKSERRKLASFINNNYYAHMIADNLPSATKYYFKNAVRYQYGYQLGFVRDGVQYINNHLDLKLKYHDVGNGNFRVVGFEIVPASVNSADYEWDQTKQTCSFTRSKEQSLIVSDADAEIHFSYSVHWEASDIKWASRWDVYLESDNGQIHWLSILNSLLIILLLSGLVAMIMLRALRRDIAKYNRDEDAEDILEESGWKLVHADVFRPPRYSRLLVAIVGSGVQIFCMVFIVIFVAMLGMLSPASRGALMSAAIFTYALMGLFAGYYSGRLYKTMRGGLWKSTAILTGVLYPALVLSLVVFLNTFLWGVGSSAAIPFGSLVAILSLWCLVSLPLVYVGFYFGFRKRPYEQPVRTNQIPRAVPDQKFRQSLIVSILVGGSMPFGAMSVELFFLMSALWNKQLYYLFGFLFIVFIIYVVCCAEIAIVLSYFQLCNENYHWWWRSVLVSGGPAFYVFGYTIYYYMTQLTLEGVIPTIVYFGYSLIMSITVFLLSSTIGFFAVFTFLRKIYSAIKID